MRALSLVGLVVVLVVSAWLCSRQQSVVPSSGASSLPQNAAVQDAKAALGSLRAAISLYRTLHQGTWPTLAQLTDGQSVLSGPLPENPFVETAVKNSVGASGGWAYDEKTGRIWLNTCTPGVAENAW